VPCLPSSAWIKSSAAGCGSCDPRKTLAFLEFAFVEKGHGGLFPQSASPTKRFLERLSAPKIGVFPAPARMLSESRCPGLRLCLASNGVLTAIENRGVGIVSRRSKMAAHNRAVLEEGTIGAIAPITSFQREAQVCTATWRSGATFGVRC
jgi:hypothetical protein